MDAGVVQTGVYASAGARVNVERPSANPCNSAALEVAQKTQAKFANKLQCVSARDFEDLAERMEARRGGRRGSKGCKFGDGGRAGSGGQGPGRQRQ